MSNGAPLQEPARVPTLKREPFPPLPVSRGCLFSPRAELGPLLFSRGRPAPRITCVCRVSSWPPSRSLLSSLGAVWSLWGERGARSDRCNLFPESLL